MNLWLRLIWLVLTARWRGRLDPPFAVSELPFRVMPHDLDTSLHMNNGRYWTLMDLGRTDVMLRMGLWRAVLKHGWTPVVSAGKLRFRRELRLFRAFTLRSRILCWSDAWAVIEHRIVSRRDDGEEVVNAAALVRVGLYDRKTRAFVRIQRMMDEMGVVAESPPPSAEVQAFLDAEEAMKQAG
ncbi:MAG: acyl-CoA thioesterase [Beijerinckiaceae bacterium]